MSRSFLHTLTLGSSFTLLVGCAYAKATVDLGAGAIGPPPSSSPSVGCGNSAPDANGVYDTPNVCGSEIHVPRPSSAPRSAVASGAIGVTFGAGFRLAPNLSVEPDAVFRAYVSFSRASVPFRDASFAGVSYLANRPSSALLLGVPIAVQWRPVSKWSFTGGAGPAVAGFSQDFTATTATGAVDHAAWSWTTLDLLVRASVEHDLWRTSSYPGGFDLRGTLGFSAEADGAGLSRGLFLSFALYVEKTPIHGH